jgi:hypothetical protein
MSLTQEKIREFVIYDEGTGALVWRRREETSQYLKSWNKRFAGRETGSLDREGYTQTEVCGKYYRVHRLIWLYVYGSWPNGQIDHIDGDRANNRLANLREATPSHNRQNLSAVTTKESGLVGVTRMSRGDRWQARIGIDGIYHYLGSFECPDEAHAAYLKAKARLHVFQPAPRQ